MKDNSAKSRILVVDDDPSGLDWLVTDFGRDYEVLSASSGEDAVRIAGDHSSIAVVVMDIRMPGMDGIEAARRIRSASPDIAIIFHTGYPGEYLERDIETKEQPFDYVEKGSHYRLRRSVKNAAESYRLKMGQASLASSTGHPKYRLIGESRQMRELRHQIAKVAQSEVKVLILGETGTGKEEVTKAIHYQSSRGKREPVILHCNHKSPELVEAELFGHKKGAFTTAIADRQGIFEYGDGGTVFLDEIGDLDITTQAKVLRVLEKGTFSRLGDPTPRKTDVRVICATNKNLEEMVKHGAFREDLYYRVREVTITTPALRERPEDIPTLVSYFTDEYCTKANTLPKVFDQTAIDAMLQYNWPGNVRQLKATVESLIATCDSDLIMGQDVQTYLRRDPALYNLSGDVGLSDRVKNFKILCVREALKVTGGNVSDAALLLKTDRSNLSKFIAENGITFE